MGRSGSLSLEIFEQHLGVAADDHQKIIEVVRHAAGQPSDGFHFLRLAELVFEGPPFGDIFRDDFEGRVAVIPGIGGASAEPDRNCGAIFLLPANFGAVKVARALEFLHQVGMGRGFQKNVLLRIKPHNVFRGIVAQHMDQCGIHIQKSAIDAGSINAVDRALYEGAIPRFGMPQRFFVTLVVDRARQLLRDECQDFLVAFAETHILVIALNNENSEGLVARAQRHTHPVDGRRPEQLHFTAGLQFFEDLGGRQQRLLRCEARTP